MQDNDRDKFVLELLKVAANCIAPIFWRKPNTSSINNGTIFFIDTGSKIFAVTAYHVYQAYLNAKNITSHLICQIDNIPFEPESRLIAGDDKLDLVTFDITPQEIEKINKIPLRGSPITWPPKPPEAGKGVFFAGYPGKERIHDKPACINFGIFAALALATSTSDTDISCQFEREYMVPIPGIPFQPQQYDAAGISGAPLITLIENTIFSWQLGGVIYESSSNFDLLKAKRASYINTDGTLSSLEKN